MIFGSRDPESHFDKLELVLQKFQDIDLKRKFLRSRTEFLGHVFRMAFTIMMLKFEQFKIFLSRTTCVLSSVLRVITCIHQRLHPLRRLSRAFSKRMSLSYGTTPSKLALTDSNMHSLMLQSLPFQITVCYIHSSPMQAF